MIVEGLVSLCSNMLYGLFSVFDFVSLPVSLINVLHSFISYGVYVVGADVLAIFAGSVVMWWGVHFSIGIALWVYDKIPFM